MKSFRTLPVSPSDYAGDAALEAVDYAESQLIRQDTQTVGNSFYDYNLCGAAGVRPINVTLNTSNNGPQNYTVPSVSLTAVDYDHQTMLLGEPEVTTLTSNIQPIFELHMAPRHYDVIDGDAVEAFFKDSSPLPNGYYQTQVAYTTGDTVATTNTSASETTQGWDASLSLGGGTTNQPGVIKKTGSVSVSAGIITSDSQKQQNTAGNKYTNTATLSGGGQYDDYVFYPQEEIYVYRYPILYPIDSARGEKQTKSDDVFGTSGDITYDPTDQFLQIMVPQEPQNWGNGSLAEWYNPINQIYNIFTCSFVKTSGVKAELYWTDEWKAENDPSTEDKIGESTAYSLPGWSRTGDSNMKEFVIGWKASDKLSKVKSASDGLLTGCLHVKLVAEDSELHTDNNWSYVRIGLYDSDIYEGTSAGVKSMSAKTSASKASPSQPPITAEYVKKSAKIITENGKNMFRQRFASQARWLFPE